MEIKEILEFWELEGPEFDKAYLGTVLASPKLETVMGDLEKIASRGSDPATVLQASTLISNLNGYRLQAHLKAGSAVRSRPRM